MFWSYNDSEKNAFYGKNVERKQKSRTRTKNTESRTFSYEYYFPKCDERVRVCK